MNVYSTKLEGKRWLRALAFSLFKQYYLTSTYVIGVFFDIVRRNKSYASFNISCFIPARSLKGTQGLNYSNINFEVSWSSALGLMAFNQPRL